MKQPCNQKSHQESHADIYNSIVANTEKQTKAILVVGACALDRLITVSNYPIEDRKYRSSDYQECCGGNAANVAIALQKLCNACLFQSNDSFYVVRLCTRVGSDAAGRQIVKKLQEAQIEVKAPLFQVVENSTSSIVHVIVNSSESKTRTCIFTPGSCGDLTVEDVHSCNLDDLFHNVVHIHADGRHTEAANLIIQEAKNRDSSISISIDSERDRLISEYDQMLFASDIIFTNPQSIREGFVRRLWPNQETTPLATTAACRCDICSFLSTPSLYETNLFFAEKGSRPSKCLIVTLGSLGAMSISHRKTDHSFDAFGECDSTFTNIKIRHKCDSKDKGNFYEASTSAYTFDIRLSGVLDSTSEIVDTTGAGDTFIGAFLLFFLMDRRKSTLNGPHEISSACLNFACWVSGLKIRGIGFVALPSGSKVDEQLGRTRSDVIAQLEQRLLPFRIVDREKP